MDLHLPSILDLSQALVLNEAIELVIHPQLLHLLHLLLPFRSLLHLPLGHLLLPLHPFLELDYISSHLLFVLLVGLAAA